jgi:nucleotide-binding universal stress UspA family protein
MIERVVVPVDFSPESARALTIAAVLADWAGATVELITVLTRNVRSDVEPKLVAAAAAVSETTTWRIVETDGQPESALLAELHAGRKELWCVGSHARGALTELFIKSVSADLVREAHMPVVLVGPHTTAAPAGRVLAVALDGTSESEAILPAAADLALVFGMTPRLLQVARHGVESLPPDAVETGYLARVAARMISLKRKDVDFDVLHSDDPAAKLVDYAAHNPDVGMIALATRGLTGGARLIDGNTAFTVAHRATIPVLVLHHVHA